MPLSRVLQSVAVDVERLLRRGETSVTAPDSTKLWNDSNQISEQCAHYALDMFAWVSRERIASHRM
jgi:hypothetical protein